MISNHYPLILALDTATICTTVALTRGTPGDGEVLACLSLSSKVTHSRRLISLVDILFKETETDWSMLGGVAVGLGPGSFTGLRIGMATAKGFAAAAKKKLLGVSTLDGLAGNCVSAQTICVVMDARKKQVYTAFYTRKADGTLARRGNLRVVTPEELAVEIVEPVIMVGDGVITYYDYWKEKLGNLVGFAPFQLHSPSAAAIGLLAGEMLKNDICLDISTASPLYIRSSDAELSLVAKKQL